LGLKNKQTQKKLIGFKPKKVDWLKLDEKMQPIPWTN
jgi:hypothetical protein